MNSLLIIAGSKIDRNLESEWSSNEHTVDQWIAYISSLPNVKSVRWVDNIHTEITFESEAARNWFILRWS